MKTGALVNVADRVFATPRGVKQPFLKGELDAPPYHIKSEDGTTEYRVQ
jgi:hypothetical protein